MLESNSEILSLFKTKSKLSNTQRTVIGHMLVNISRIVGAAYEKVIGIKKQDTFFQFSLYFDHCTPGRVFF